MSDEIECVLDDTEILEEVKETDKNLEKFTIELLKEKGKI